VFEPLKKTPFSIMSAWPIDVSQKPCTTIVPGRELNCDSKSILKDHLATEDRAFQTVISPPEALIEGRNSKESKP
jgi:hypothetical protein